MLIWAPRLRSQLSRTGLFVAGLTKMEVAKAPFSRLALVLLVSCLLVRETRAQEAEACTEDEFQCGNGRCIPDSFQCDGEDDCRDNSDEFNCTGCRRGKFMCEDGGCLPSIFRCDGIGDCDDDSDETNCRLGFLDTLGGVFDELTTTQTVPRPYPVTSVPPSSVLEQGTVLAVCTDQEFTCADGSRCVPRLFVCDGERDCADNSDEMDCQAKPCSFVRCPNESIQFSLPKHDNYIIVDFSKYVVAIDDEFNEMTPIVDPDRSPNVTYPVTKYQVSSNKTLEGGQYLNPVIRFLGCNDTCDVSVLIIDNTAPYILSCPDLSQNLYGEDCRDVNLYDYFSKSTIASCFGDNVGITDVICKQTVLYRIAIGETAYITCYTTDMVGSSSASYDIAFHCKKKVCPRLKPPAYGAFVCHEDFLVERCALFCKEGKLHRRKNIFECDMTDPSGTWSGASVDDDIICESRGRHKQQFTFNVSCDPDDVDFHREVKRTLSDTGYRHQLCYNMSDDDCEITIFCGRCSQDIDGCSQDQETGYFHSNCTENGGTCVSLTTSVAWTAERTAWSTVDQTAPFNTAMKPTTALPKTTTTNSEAPLTTPPKSTITTSITKAHDQAFRSSTAGETITTTNTYLPTTSTVIAEGQTTTTTTAPGSSSQTVTTTGTQHVSLTSKLLTSTSSPTITPLSTPTTTTASSSKAVTTPNAILPTTMTMSKHLVATEAKPGTTKTAVTRSISPSRTPTTTASHAPGSKTTDTPLFLSLLYPNPQVTPKTTRTFTSSLPTTGTVTVTFATVSTSHKPPILTNSEVPTTSTTMMTTTPTQSTATTTTKAQAFRSSTAGETITTSKTNLPATSTVIAEGQTRVLTGVITTEPPLSAATLTTTVHTSPHQTSQSTEILRNRGTNMLPPPKKTNSGLGKPHKEYKFPTVPAISAAATVSVVLVLAAIICLKKKKKVVEDSSVPRIDTYCQSTPVPCNDTATSSEVEDVPEGLILETVD